MSIRRASLVALLPLLMIACADAGSSVPSGNDELEGVTWILRDASIASLVGEVPSQARVDITFEDGEVGGRAACNIYGGDFQLDGATITIGALSMTEMACEEPLMALESAYLAVLAHVRGYSVSDGSLTLTGEEMDDLTFEAEEPVEPLPLTGTNWILESIASGDAVSSTVAGTEATLALASDGTASGNASCNRFTATYEVGEGYPDVQTLVFGPIATTKMACEPDVDAQERVYLEGLEKAGRYLIDGERLSLFDDDGNLLLAFTGS